VRLSAATAERLPGGVSRPAYDRDAQTIGIVHFGIGAFHRAHQAVYTDGAMGAGDRDWAIAGLSLRSPAVRDAMAPQDGLYTVTERGADGERGRLIGAVRDLLVAPHDPEAVIRLIAAPATSIVSFTITEKGYVPDAPAALADRGGEGSPSSIYGFLRHGLARRRAAGLPGLTLLSCDNLSGNGAKLRGWLGGFLAEADPALLAWFEAECATPSMMVDRIVPATTAEDLAAIEARLGLRDEAAVVTEPFSQWVIEDRFAGRRPRWEAVGATFVEDVSVYEVAKLRMLNGAHSALAYLGLRSGHEFVHQAIADPAIRPLVTRLMVEEAGATLPKGFAVADYAQRLLDRFANAALAHRLRQIAMDGSQKIPQRWLATLEESRQAGRRCPAILAALAAWMLFVRGACGLVDDPMAERLAGLWAQAGTAGITRALFGRDGLFAQYWWADEEDLNSLERLVQGGQPAAGTTR